ncbi:MAG: hypothetical protein AMXMBFR59_07350 [Rhodanobacteraceae bacterium]
MLKLLWPVLLSGVSFTAVAQTGRGGEGAPGGPPRGWQVGVGAVVSDSPYAGEGTRVVPIPLIGYEGERFYFRGITAGWTLLERGGFALTAQARLRLDGFSVDDLGRAALARNGVDYRLLEDRDRGIDAGLGLQWRGAAGELEIGLLTDVSGASDGQEVSVEYGYPVRLGAATLTPRVGVSWLSDDMADYYYGTLDEEAARGVVDYRPGSVTMPHIAISYRRPFGKKWTMLANVKYVRLPDEITVSPFIEPGVDGATSVFVGFSRWF